MCAFAWVDREVRPGERAFVARLALRLDLDEDGRRRVETWLAQPPPLDSIDAALVPREHRMQFIRAIESVIASDAEISPLETEQLLAFAQRLRRA